MTAAPQTAFTDSWRRPAGPDLADPQTRRELSRAAVLGVARIADLWTITSPVTCELLGGISESTWQRWQRSPNTAVLSKDQLTRASLIGGIFAALRTLYSVPYADAWPTLVDSHPLFGGRTPIAVMCAGEIEVMYATRELLDGWIG